MRSATGQRSGGEPDHRGDPARQLGDRLHLRREREPDHQDGGGNTDYYSYDNENRLVSLDYNTGPEGAAGTYSYAYDYRTRRVGRTEPGTATARIVFNGGTSIQEYGSGSDPVVEYVRGAGMGGGVGGLEYSDRSGDLRFNQYNGRGDVVAQTDASANPVYQTLYQAFGANPDEIGTTLDRQRANTKELDPTSLINDGFRYRDTDTGTFISRDPIGFLAGPNMYTYVQQNPWSKFDPQGLADQDTTAQILSFTPLPVTVCIRCHGVDAGGFHGDVNDFRGIEAIPGSGPDAMLGVSCIGTCLNQCRCTGDTRLYFRANSEMGRPGAKNRTIIKFPENSSSGTGVRCVQTIGAAPGSDHYEQLPALL